MISIFAVFLLTCCILAFAGFFAFVVMPIFLDWVMKFDHVKDPPVTLVKKVDREESEYYHEEDGLSKLYQKLTES